MNSFEQQPKIFLKKFIIKYQNFIKSSYAPKQEIEKILEDYNNLADKNNLPKEFLDKIKYCKEILKILKEKKNKLK